MAMVVDRRQSPDAHYPPQCERQDYAVQQPRFTADQGAIFADVGAWEEDEILADGRA